MTKSKASSVTIWIAGAMLSIGLAAAGLYFAGAANSSGHLLFLIMVSGVGLAVLLAVAGFAIDWQQKVSTTASPAAVPASSITTGATNYGQQIAGNSGNVHIGDVHNTPAQPARPARDFRNEWLALADKVVHNCHFLRADWSMNNILGEQWRVPGGSEKNVCQAWLRQAGAMLLVSPNVREQLSKCVAEDPDDLNRWLRYLKERYIFELGHFLSGVTDDGETEKIQLGTIPDLAGQSHKACIDCSTIELRRE